jgi:murein DD-endopeptidase MepM/ murein hydrolase activator NlpD
VSYAAAHHDYPATDIFAGRGCGVVSPVPGVVDEVRRTDRWSFATNRGADRGGRFVSVVGDDGVRYYLAHLQVVAPGIRAGHAVRAGQPLGAVGDSGSARGTGTHLHFGISWPTAKGTWWVRRGMVLPSPYLDAWRAHHARSPVRAVAARRRAVGPSPHCTNYC